MTNEEYAILAFPVVSADDAKQLPYPYVFVTAEGSVHELDARRRTYLETPYHPCDGGRPYVKTDYNDKDGWGSLEGPCPRSAIPSNILINAEPVPPPPAEPFLDTLRGLTERAGATLVEHPDGTYVTSRRPIKKWWQFWR